MRRGGLSARPRIHEVFEEQAKRHPQAVAVVFGEQELSYEELKVRSGQLAGFLSSLGVGPGERVAVCLEPSIEMVVGLLGILKAGGAYVPIDPRYPEERIALMLEDSGAGVVLTSQGLTWRFSGRPVRSVCLDGDWESIRRLGGSRGEQDAYTAGPEDVAYVMYTSGSTGKPKGVMVPHRAVNRLVINSDYVRLGSGDVVAQIANCCFDAATFEIWGALLNGSRLVGIQREDVLSAESFSGELSRHGVTTLFVTTALFNELVHERADIFSELRNVLFGGEECDAGVVKKVMEGDGPPQRLLHVYGPTETTTFATWYEVRSGQRSWQGRIPIGRPIANTQVYILDRHLNAVPVGVAGEICIGGAGVAKGYLNRLELTAERFIPSPFATGERLYRTGDLGRFLSDGNIEFLGRGDDQVKIRGFRIEPGEIEAVLAGHRAVRQAVVRVRESGRAEKDKQLVSYVVLADGQNTGRITEELSAFVKQKLPDYMVPSAFVILDKLPLTPNGKIDRRALPAPSRQRQTEGYRAPRTPREEILCGIYAELLGLERVGINDNFFALGGDSILSIALVSRVRRRGLELTPREVFELRTVEALAAAARIPNLNDGSQFHAADAIGKIVATPIMRWLQERGGPIERFCQSVLLEVPAELTEQNLATLLQTIIDGHDMLRLQLERNTEGDWELQIAPRGAVQAEACLSQVNLAGLEKPAREESTQTAVREAESRLDPQAGRMIQAVWFRGAEPGMLSLIIHHLAVDGVSWRILVSDLATAWRSLVRGEIPQIEPVGTPFRLWTQHLAEVARTPAVLAELRTWEAILEGDKALVSGVVLDPIRDTLSSAGLLRIELPANITSALLTEVAAAFHAKVNDVLLGALAVAIAEWRNARGHGNDGPILVDVEGHGREPMAGGIDLSRTVGWFTSLFPVGLDPGLMDIDEAMAGGPSMGRAIKRIKEQLRAVPGQGLGYGLLRYLNPESRTRLAGRCEPQIGFNYLGRFTIEESKEWSLAQGGGIDGGADPTTPLSHLININALALDTADGPCLSATWRWASALLAESEVRSLAEGWRRALEALIRHIQQPGAGGHTPSDFPLVVVSAEQVEQLEVAYPDLEEILPLSPLQEGLLFHALFDRSVVDPYSVQICMEFEGLQDVARLKRALNALIRRHANLRSAFRNEGLQRPVQVIVRDVEVPWQEEDLSALDGERQETRRMELLAAELAQRFEPSEAPLLRFTLLRVGPKRHVLVFTNHHLLLDGWSFPVLLGEFFALYRDDGSPAALPRVRPYSEYLAWLAKQDSEAALASWRDYLADLDGPTLLASPSHRDASSTAPQFLQSELPEHLCHALQRLARERGLTVNTIMQGLWALLLGRLTGRDDVVFGVTVSGRPAELPGVEQMLGLLINTLPLRVRLNSEESLATLFTGIQESQARLLPFQHVSLAEIKQQTKCGELFDTIMVFENYPLDNAALTQPVDGLRLAGIQARDVTHYPLSLKVVPRERLRLRMDYDPTRIEQARSETIAALLLRLLDQAVATPDMPLNRLDLLSSEERQRLLKDFNDTAQPLPEVTLQQLFDAQVAQSPQATALILGEKTLSYRELSSRADHLAAYLRICGIQRGFHVALCVDRSLEMIVGMLGILKAGGVYVPLDPAYPAERLTFLLNEVAAPVILTVAEAQAALPPTGAKVICLDRDWPLIEGTRMPISTGAASEARSTDLAHVIFTSGSTGTPKGVAVPHCAIIRLVLNTNYLELGPQDRIAHLSNVCFDAATFEIWGALLNGACVVLIPQAVALDPERFATELERHKISTLFVTTALFNELVAVNDRIFQGVKQVLFGGEAVNPEPVRRVLASGGPPRRLLHVYGPTECTTFAIFYPVTRVEKDAATIPIGRPISNTTVYVLDQHGKQVPIGVPGELYLGGPGLAHGYLNRPELTLEKFVPNPFGTEKGERLYKTGDIVRYLPDGNIEFIGRLDHQIKIRGFRIEPGEVEVALGRHPDVEAVIVVARESDLGERQLVAYIVPRNGNLPQDWREFLRSKLPDYMVPGTFVLLKKLPLTSTGKIDRGALPAPTFENDTIEPIHPRNATEQMVAEAWSAVIDAERVGVHEDFFDLGGHSLLAMRVISRLRSASGLDIPLRVFFENSTVAALAEYIDGARCSGAKTSFAPLAVDHEDLVL